MSQADLLTTVETVPSGEAPLVGSGDAQPSAGAPLPRDDFFGAAGTVEAQLGKLTNRLLAEAEGDPLVEQRVRRLLSQAYERFAGARVRRFLPILIERDVRDQLGGR